jgi:tRNA(Ile)-lysidine synthetase-like protein
MRVEIKPGKYVVAVSGGVDSMVLLDLLSSLPEVDLVVAHFNHGIRADAAEDEGLVRKTAHGLGLPFIAGYGHLGQGASEDAARRARYGFLFSVQTKSGADAVITAHHQDDLIETAFINLLRGTGRKGLTAISANPKVIRPLLGYSKQQLLGYAERNRLAWREDSTNQTELYLRNQLRRRTLGKLTAGDREKIIKNIDKVAKVDIKINDYIAKLSQIICDNQVIDRESFAALPSVVAEELVYFWLKQKRLADFDKSTVRRVSQALKTYQPNSSLPVKDNLVLDVHKKSAHFSYSA